MRKIAILISFCVCFVFAANAGQLFGSFQLTTLTTAQSNSPPFYTNLASVFIPSCSVTNVALSISNAYIGVYRFSLDGGSTYFTNGSPVFIPTNTAAATYAIPGQFVQIPIIIEMLAITNTANTGTIQLGVTSP